MAKHKSVQLPTKAQANSARVRQHHRMTKSPGLVTREQESVSARRELSTIQDTGVATKAQIARAQAVVDRADRALGRQQDTARRAGRPVK